MDPMALLEMERRTGISSKDVDDFATRMDLVSEAMEQIKNGTFDPETCTIPGYKSPAQEAREADERARKEAERRRKAEEKQRQEKAEEHDQWWNRAKLRFSIERGEDDDDGGEENQAKPQDATSEATQWANRVLAAYKARDANDYSVWNNWVPEDPVTLEEKAAREAALEKVRNAEFEKNNPQFCQQFRGDLVKRQQTQREREREAEKYKTMGNRHYKRREYELAIVQYQKALEQSPFNVAVLTNMAQCFLRLDALDDSVEFSTRALYVDPTHVKALSRRAAVWHRQQQWEQAVRDMDKALALDPENEDVVEQHSIIVGDYEDALTQRQLYAKLTSTTTTGDNEAAAELRFMTEQLSKMDAQEKDADLNGSADASVNEAWLGYELLVPCLERNPDARDLLRTSGELAKLTQRLLSVFTSLAALVEKWTSREHEQDAKIREERTLTTMVGAVAACVTNSPRNQIVLYRDTAFRATIVSFLSSSNDIKLTQLPAPLCEKLLRLVEEAIEAKSWKRHVLSTPAAIHSVLAVVSSPIGSGVSSSHTQALASAAVSASSILMTISGDDLHGVKALASEPSCLEAIADGLQSHRRSTATLSNLLGVLTNISTSVAVRGMLDTSSSALRSRLVRSLLVLSSHFTKSTLTSQKRRLYLVCAERALAALLNFSFQPESPVREELVTHDVVAVAHAVLGYVAASNINELMLVVSRVISLLCRLHSFLAEDSVPKTLHSELASLYLLDELYKICQLSLPLFAASSAVEVSSNLWQTHAQIWCHVGWCISLPAFVESTRSYLQDKQALPAMVETLDLVNGQRLYRRNASDTPTGPERITGNVVKVLIAMVPSEDQRAVWTRKPNLGVLVDALQHLPDGLARKNVAILLAKLCQRFGDAVKDTVRDLRGIEMMLSVSKSLTTPSKTKEAVAF